MQKTRKPIHPGNVFLHDVLIPLGITITDAAKMMGITRKALSEFINEKSSCSVQIAIRIAKVTQTSAESWLSMQIKCDLWDSRQIKLEPLQVFPKVTV